MKTIISTLLLLSLAAMFGGCTMGKKWVMSFEKNPFPNDPESVARGQVIFKRECVGCHNEDGRGGGPLAKDLTLKTTDLVEYAKVNSVNNVALHVKHGKFDTMPKFVKNLSEYDVWDVANYVKTLK